jgi:hypothetical protein
LEIAPIVMGGKRGRSGIRASDGVLEGRWRRASLHAAEYEKAGIGLQKAGTMERGQKAGYSNNKDE